MRDLQIASFSVTETTLYLDTHPNDKEALKALAGYCEQEKEAKERYEAEYGALTACACSLKNTECEPPRFNWALTPMPWEQTDC